MVFHIIGLGLADERDITVRGLEIVKRCSKVYLEAYTSLLLVDSTKLENFYGVPVMVADRDMVETQADVILEGAAHSDVAFLVVGDPFGATTHTDMQLRAKAAGIAVNVVHNASIMNAVGICGLQLYRFGEAVSIVFFTESWRPDSFYPKILANRRQGLHTLCLLDIQVKEPTLESLAQGRKVYQPPRFLTINQAISQLLEVEDRRQEGAYSRESICVGLARVGSESQSIVSGSLADLESVSFGPPLHTLVISGDLHHIEADCLQIFAKAEVSERT